MARKPSKRSTLVCVTGEDKIAHVERIVRRLVSEIEQLPSEVLYREPEPGEWPVMSTLAHLEELLPYWAREAADLAKAPGKAVGRRHDDPRRIGAVQQHGHDSLDAIVPRIRGSLAECLGTLRAIPGEAWSVIGQHPTRGPMSVEQVVEAFLVDHAEEHTNQIHATLRALQTRQRP